MDKLKIDVTEEGLNLLDNYNKYSGQTQFITRLTPKEAYEFIHDIINALANWHRLTGKNIDDPKCF